MAHVTPTRSPVKEPGPSLTAIASMSVFRTRASFTTVSTPVMMSLACRAPSGKVYHAMTSPSLQIATLPILPLVSIPIIVISGQCYSKSLAAKPLR